MTGDVGLYDWDEKSMKKNDEDEDDGMKQEVDFKSFMMLLDMSDLWFLKRKKEDEGVRETVTRDKEQVLRCQITERAGLTCSNDFVYERQKLTFSTFIDFEPV